MLVVRFISLLNIHLVNNYNVYHFLNINLNEINYVFRIISFSRFNTAKTFKRGTILRNIKINNYLISIYFCINECTIRVTKKFCKNTMCQKIATLMKMFYRFVYIINFIILRNKFSKLFVLLTLT